METSPFSIQIDARSEAIVEDTSWQLEQGTDIREDLMLFLEVEGRHRGRLSAELIIKKKPQDGITELERYVSFNNIEIDFELRKKGLGSLMIKEMENIPIQTISTI